MGVTIIFILSMFVAVVGGVCHCKTSCETFPDSPCTSTLGEDHCEIGWFGPFCQMQNVALHKQTSQSSTYTNDDGTYPSRLAVDGTARNDFLLTPFTCTHTAGTENPTWTVYVGASVWISRMRLYLRNNTDPARNYGMAILVDDQTCQRWHYGPPFITGDVKCNPALYGRRVSISVSSNVLILCEVQIFICSDGWFGDECDKQCNCLSDTELCDKLSGNCASGCAAGFMDTGCQTACYDGRFGSSCNNECGNCLNNAACNKATGRCPSGCEPGWVGRKCLKPCSGGSFGARCSSKCGKCVSGTVCNKRTGSCPRGCEPGWKNNDCREPCPDGYFGTECSSKCGRCVSGAVCNKTTGSCPGGCVAGWRNRDCREPCKDGQYGDRCSLMCGHCHNPHVCNKTTGHCPQGCQGNYEAPLCRICPDHYFGPGCTSKCGECVSGAVCDKTTGFCPGGCKAGWRDETCLEPCEDGQYGDGCRVTCGHCHNSSVCNKTTGHCPQGCQGNYEGPLCRKSTEVGPTGAGGMVAGVLVTLLVIIVLIIVLVIVLKRRQQQSKPPNNNVEERIQVSRLNAGETRGSPAAKENKGQGEDEDEDALFGVENDLHVSSEDTPTYYNSIPPHMTLDKLKHRVTDKKERSTLETQFKVIPYGLKHAHDVGKKPENKAKNRFAALYPYDDTRVVLKDGGHDYINASYVGAFDGIQKYIATQGPNPVTIGDLWRMIWQERVTTIVMLTQLVEVNRKKCEQYWPRGTETKQYGRFTVSNKEVITRPDYTISTLIVQGNGSETRTIHHFHYTTWPDHGVPSAPALVSFWKKVRKNKRTGGPLVVHCSAGVGRTGAFIALDYLADEYESGNKVNVFICVTRMREARMNMVQTLSQYQFVHDAVLEALCSQGTQYSAQDLTNKLGSDNRYTNQMEDTLKQQFRSLMDLKQDLSDKDVSDAKLPENGAKNRDKNILPGNKARLHLSTPVPGRNGYINAVALPSVVRASMLVVTQTPLPDTVVDFWRLVADHDCFTVVCLDVSKDAQKTYPLPNKELQCGPFSIKLTDTKQTDVYSERQLEFNNKKNHGACVPVKVFSLTSPDTMSRDMTSLLDLVNRVDKVITSADHKVLVHCHDGARLSGVFCAALNVIGRLRLDSEMDIFLTIRELQCVRPQFVQTLEQYTLCYNLAREYNLSSSIYANL